MQIESKSKFQLFIAALIAAGWAYFRLACPVVDRLTKWIVNRKWRKSSDLGTDLKSVPKRRKP